MKINFFCPRWGSENIPWDMFCQKVKSAGYDGIEWAIPSATKADELDQVWNLALKNDLLLTAQHYDTNKKNFDEHRQAYKSWLEMTKPFPWFKISSQTGKDFFSFDQNCELIGLGNAAGAIHETHRGKFSFAAHITKTFLENIPELRLTLDVSHWICVAESFLEDQSDALTLAIERTDHIHARIGYPEGPQVPDPRTTESKLALDRHLACWDRVVALKKITGEPISVTPEFGPYPYMINLPNTKQPVADQWDINCFMHDLLRKRYSL